MDVDKNGKNNLPTENDAQNAFYMKVLNDMNTKAGVSQGLTQMPKDSKLTSSRAFSVNSASNVTDIANQVSNYRDSYTDTCFRRTAPYGGTMPVSFERWLRAVDIATSSNSGKRVKADVASAIYAQVEKSTASTYQNLCRMTAEPFPLISSGKANDINSNNVREQPLIDPQNGKCTASRYARVCLSPLGQIATKWYHDTPMSRLKIHKGIVPLCLLRKTQAWTLGFRTEMRPLNPSELFNVMAKMIELNSPDLDGLTLQQYFKGPDLGEGYNIFMTNESLMTLYSTGKGSITVVPQITVDRSNNRIIFQRPVLDQTSNKLATMFHKKLIDSIENKIPINYSTFVIGDTITPSGRKTYVKVDRFIGTDEQIIAELTSSTEFQKTVSLTNSVLLPNEGTETNLAKYEGIRYTCDLMSIKDTLWMHINWERENVLNKYKEKLLDMQAALKNAKLLDKVTRPRVADFIHACMKQPKRATIVAEVFSKDPEVRAKTSKYNCKDLRDFKCETLYDELIAEGKLHPDSTDYWYEGEDFTINETHEIYKEKGGLNLNGEVINILSILFMRDRYKNYWQIYENEINNCKRMIDNSFLRDKEILEDLEQYAMNPQFQRKSPVYYLYEDTRRKKKKKITPEDLLVKPNEKWDQVVQPVTIYYSPTSMFKSYGVNMNIYHKINIERRGFKPNRAINCLNTEFMVLYYNNTKAYFRPCDIEFTPYEYRNIQGIIPFSDKRRILVLVYETSKVANKPYLRSKYMVIPPEVSTDNYQDDGKKKSKSKTIIADTLEDNESLGAWMYLDDEDGNPYKDEMCVLFLLSGMLDRVTDKVYTTGTAKIKMSDIIADGKKHKFTPEWGVVTDLVAFDNSSDKDWPAFYMRSHDSLKDPGGDPIYMNGMPLPSLYNADNLSYSIHTEFYLGRTFLGNWKECGIVVTQDYSHGKRGVITENRFLYRREAVSEKIYKTLGSEVFKNWDKLHRVFAYTTKAYKEWKLSELDDWSIIDKRFGFPKTKPVNKEALDFCDQFFAERDDFNVRLVDSPMRTLILKGINLDEDLSLKNGFEESIVEDDQPDNDGNVNQNNENQDSVEDKLSDVYKLDN